MPSEQQRSCNASQETYSCWVDPILASHLYQNYHKSLSKKKHIESSSNLILNIRERWKFNPSVDSITLKISLSVVTQVSHNDATLSSDASDPDEMDVAVRITHGWIVGRDVPAMEAVKEYRSYTPC